MSEQPTIQCAENGPYLIKHLTALSNSKGEALETKATTALCRCGASANKPFCDGSHTKTGFDSARADDRRPDRLDTYAGEAVTVRDNRGVCCHAGECTSRLPDVWRMGQDPWIDPDADTIEAIADVVARCPSGALSLSGDDVPEDAGDGSPRIVVSKDGPYHVRGDVTLQDAEWGAGARKTRFALCRCGHSKNKPFCDGQHWDAKFQDAAN